MTLPFRCSTMGDRKQAGQLLLLTVCQDVCLQVLLLFNKWQLIEQACTSSFRASGGCSVSPAALVAGWLGLMISEERVDTFVAIHNAMLQVLKVWISFQELSLILAKACASVHAPGHALTRLCPCIFEPYYVLLGGSTVGKGIEYPTRTLICDACVTAALAPWTSCLKAATYFIGKTQWRAALW